MKIEEVLAKEFESIRVDLIKAYENKKMKSSGRWANSLEVEITSTETIYTAKILGERYTEQLVFGRKPGTFPPIKAIEQWIKDKGIQPIEANLKISTLAFLIARKITREGTKYFKQGGTDLVSSVVTPKRIQDIINKISEINVGIITRGLVEQLKMVA